MARPSWMTDRKRVDATKGVTINIRQHHIDAAVALSGPECVAALCTLNALDAAYVWFYRSKAYVAWDETGDIMRYQNSHSLVKNVIEILDDPKRLNSEIKPGLYDLLPPPPNQRLGMNRDAKNPGAKGPKSDRGHRVMGRMTLAERVPQEVN